MVKTALHILGSPYCGSTLLSHLLASGPGAISIGEAQRFRAFGQFATTPEHYLDECSFCATHESYACSIWTKELADRVKADGLTRAYAGLIYGLDADLIIDTSKEATWLRLMVSSGHLPSVARLGCVVMVRHPVAFAKSNARRVPNQSLHWHVNGWRNIYSFILHSLAQLCIPYVIMRYETLLTDPVLHAGRVLANLVPGARVDVSQMRSRPHHPLGGNLAELARNTGFEPERFRHEYVGDDFNTRRVAEWIENGTIAQEKERGIYRSKHEFEPDDAELLLEPGVASLCRMLGYTTKDLSLEFVSG